jgi:hypothetical protein
MHLCHTEAKSKVPDWGMKATLALGKERKVGFGIGLPVVNVLESAKGEVRVNSGIGSHTPCFFLWIRPLFS